SRRFRWSMNDPRFRRDSESGAGAPLGRVQHGAMLQLRSALRAEIAIGPAVGGPVNAHVVRPVDPAQNLACRGTDHAADTSADRRADHVAGRNAAYHGAA